MKCKRKIIEKKIIQKTSAKCLKKLKNNANDNVNVVCNWSLVKKKKKLNIFKPRISILTAILTTATKKYTYTLIKAEKKTLRKKNNIK